MKIIRLWDVLYLIVGIPFLFFNIVTSRAFTELKTILLAILVIIAVIEMIAGKIKVNRKVFIYIIIFLIFYICSLFYGIFNGYEFEIQKDFALIQYYVITPIVVLILSNVFFKKEYRLQKMFKILQLITLFVVIMNVLKIFALKNILPDIDFFNLLFISSDIKGTEVTLRIANESSLMYLLPMYIVLFFQDSTQQNKVINFMILIFGMTYSLLSGRKMLILAAVITIGFMIFKELYSKKIKIKNIIIVLCLGIGIMIIINKFSSVIGMNNIFYNIYQTVVKGFSGDAYGVVSRKSDFDALIDLWLQSPFYGNGLNSYAIMELANPITKWSYEIMYIALLAQTGIIGLGILVFGVYSLIRTMIIKYKKSSNIYYLATTIGFLSFFICGASNPLIYIAWPWIITVSVYSSNIDNFKIIN